MRAVCEAAESRLKASKIEVPESRLKHSSRLPQEEMQGLLTKLKRLVPNMPRNRKVTKLEVIQYVIDYILDLQTALESHPASRQPLGVISGQSVNNTCAAQEVTQTVEKMAILSEVNNRPVSC